MTWKLTGNNRFSPFLFSIIFQVKPKVMQNTKEMQNDTEVVKAVAKTLTIFLTKVRILLEILGCSQPCCHGNMKLTPQKNIPRFPLNFNT